MVRLSVLVFMYARTLVFGFIRLTSAMCANWFSWTTTYL